MLGKLMKYEWRGLRGPLVIILCVLFGTTLLSCAAISTINFAYDDVVLGLSMLTIVLSLMLYYFGIIGSTIGIAIIIAVRFYKTSYTDQGYLTHTLPVTAKQLLAAKTIVAVLCHMLITVCIAVSIVIVVSTLGYRISGQLGDVLELYNETSDYFKYYFDQSLPGYIVFWIITGIISSICSVINIFGCISLGQLYTKHRVIGAILAYFALYMVQAFIGYLGTIFMLFGIAAAERRNEAMSLLGVTTPTTVISLIASIIIAVALYFANLHMMTKRLNLE